MRLGFTASSPLPRTYSVGFAAQAVQVLRRNIPSKPTDGDVGVALNRRRTDMTGRRGRVLPRPSRRCAAATSPQQVRELPSPTATPPPRLTLPALDERGGFGVDTFSVNGAGAEHLPIDGYGDNASRRRPWLPVTNRTPSGVSSRPELLRRVRSLGRAVLNTITAAHRLLPRTLLYLLDPG